MPKRKVSKKFKLGSLSFTLVEVLIVLSLVSGLLIFSFISIPTQLSRARDAVRKGHLDSYKKAIDLYYQENNCYPTSVPSCGNPLVLRGEVVEEKLPCDPLNGFSYTYLAESNACPKWFQLYTTLEYSQDQIIDKVSCREGCGPSCQFNYGVSSPNQNLNPYCSTSNPPSGSSPLQYVCGPGNSGCLVVENPQESGCPNIYLNDATCQNACGDPQNRCHDASGKSN